MKTPTNIYVVEYTTLQGEQRLTTPTTHLVNAIFFARTYKGRIASYTFDNYVPYKEEDEKPVAVKKIKKVRKVRKTVE